MMQGVVLQRLPCGAAPPSSRSRNSAAVATPDPLGPIGRRPAQGIGKVGVDRGLRAAFSRVPAAVHLWHRQSRREETSRTACYPYRSGKAPHASKVSIIHSQHLRKERPVGNAAR